MTDEPVGKERRRDCSDCVSHLEHNRRIQTMENDLRDHKKQAHDDLQSFIERNHASHTTLWESINGLEKSKVSLRLFIWAMGSVLSIVVLVSSLQWNKMNEVLDATKSSETTAVIVKNELKGLREDVSEIKKKVDNGPQTDPALQNELKLMRELMKLQLEQMKKMTQ